MRRRRSDDPDSRLAPTMIEIPADLVDEVRRGAWRELHLVAEAVIDVGLVPGVHTTLKQRQEHRTSAEGVWALLDCLGWTNDDQQRDLQLDASRHAMALRAALGRASDDLECWLTDTDDSRDVPRRSQVAAKARALRELATSLQGHASMSAGSVPVDGSRVQGSVAGPLSVLTRRERQVLRLLGARWSYARIALELGISVETVRTHSARGRRKLGVKSRQELIAIISNISG